MGLAPGLGLLAGEEVLSRAILRWLEDEEASRGFYEAFQPWEILRHVEGLWGFLHARRLMALDEKGFLREWRRYPEALLSFLSSGYLFWEDYRRFLRQGYALLLAQGWREKEARWLLAYPSLIRNVDQKPPLKREGPQGTSLSLTLPPPPGGASPRA